MVRAKMFVTEKNHRHMQGDQVFAEVKLAPVYAGLDGVPANSDWSKATPSGGLQMGITVRAAIDFFELGKSYYLDIKPAD